MNKCFVWKERSIYLINVIKKVAEKPSVPDFTDEYLISAERKHSKGSSLKCLFNNLVLL